MACKAEVMGGDWIPAYAGMTKEGRNDKKEARTTKGAGIGAV